MQTEDHVGCNNGWSSYDAINVPCSKYQSSNQLETIESDLSDGPLKILGLADPLARCIATAI
ncbi:hypothetical protein MSG28_001435 [Choristoneura fumiferana]|uniref:Uncharacterized protein n=1 Tax=Choristoneura fumiferana TaxID=7141 RepID=A0ACC0KUM3_CHOFU|nr:hypothetical protein MSG28_001435 [Choristoneura fumiferana]